MKLKLILCLLFTLVVGCNLPTDAPKTPKPPVTSGYKPSLDSFFENISEPAEFEEMQVQSKKTINIAVLLPVTGVYSRIGSEGLDAISLAQKHLGDGVKIKVFDTMGIKSNIYKIHSQIENEDFDVIIGPLFNFETKELAGLEHKLPIISLSNDTSIKQNNILIFGLNGNDNIKDPVSFFANLDKKNIMAIFPNSTNGAKQYRVFKESAMENKSNIMRVEFYDDTGISDISRYTSKILNGLTQKEYILKKDGKVVAERSVKEQEKTTPNFIVTDFYEIKDVKAEVIFVYASGSKSAEIAEILNRPGNREKLKGISVVMLDFDFYKTNLKAYNNMFFYANSYPKFKKFSEDIYEADGYAPTKLSAILFDAIFYSVYVNNQSFGGIGARKIHTEYEGFNGVMGSFTVKNNHVRRNGRMMFVTEGVVKELGTFQVNHEKSSKNLLDKNVDANINYLNEDFD